MDTKATAAGAAGKDITGRDHYIVCKALAYAIEAIDRLPSEWQEGSDRDDMLQLLEAMSLHANRDRHFAAGHLTATGEMDDASIEMLVSGDVPAPSEADFTSDEEDRNPAGVLRSH
jgi:hypothetical protein